MILQRLKDQFRQNWSSDIQNSNSCWNYRLFKTVHKLENYLIKLPPLFGITYVNLELATQDSPL